MKWKPVARVPTGLVSLTQAPQWHTASKTWYARRGDGSSATATRRAAGAARRAERARELRLRREPRGT